MLHDTSEDSLQDAEYSKEGIRIIVTKTKAACLPRKSFQCTRHVNGTLMKSGIRGELKHLRVTSMQEAESDVEITGVGI